MNISTNAFDEIPYYCGCTRFDASPCLSRFLLNIDISFDVVRCTYLFVVIEVFYLLG